MIKDFAASNKLSNSASIADSSSFFLNLFRNRLHNTKHNNMKKSIRLLGVLLLMMVFTRTLLAQTSAGANASSGDYRTHTTGNWSSSTTWETRDGSGNWTTPATPPTSANNIYVQNGHTLTVDGTVNCKDLHENTSGVIALGTNTLNVYGKIRAYTGTAVTGAASSDATFYSGQTNVGPAGTMFTVSSGLLQFVGSTRQLTFTGEWGTATASSNTLNINIALNDNSQTLTLGVGMKFNNITLSTGNLNAGNNAVNIGASGTLEIKSGTTFTTPRTAAAIVANSSSAKGGTFLIDAGGTLNLTGAAPLIDITTFTNNGTVSYTSTTAAQSLLAAGVVSGDASTATINSSYSTLIINNTYSTNTVTAATAVAVSSSLVLTAGTFDMGSNQLTGAFSINNTGAGTLKTSNASNPPIPNGLTFPTGTTVNYYGSSQPIATGNYNNLSLTTATGTTFPSGTVAIAGTFTPASIISASQGTINFTGSTQAIPVFNYYNLDLTNASGTTFPSGTVGISNTFTPASITSASQGTINLKGSTQSIPAFNYYSLDLTSATSTTFPSGTVGIANTFTPASITTASQGTINFNNATGNQTIPAFNYFNLTNSSTSTNLNSLAPTGTIGVAGTYTIAGSKGLSGTNSITYGSNATLAHTGSSCTLTSTTPEWPVINGPTNVNLNNSGSILYFPYSSINNFALTSNVATITTSSAHGFSVGQSVIISSIAPSSGAVLDGTFIITGVPTPNTFTFSKTNADITSTPATAGNANTTNLATITTVALTSNVATITTAANHGYSAGQVVTIENVSVSGAVFNGSYSITGVTSNTFSFAKTNANISATSATGLCTASSLPVVIVGEALTSNVATITTATAHGYSVNQNVTIANVSVNGTVFNGTYTITGVTTYTFTYAKTNANISFVAATGYAYVPTVTSIARAVPGTMYINGGTFTLGAGNMLVFGNGSTINRNTTGGKFNLSGGTYYFGSTSTDVVNLNINASVSTSGELPSTTTGKIALTVNGATYTLSGNASNCLKSVAFTGTTPIIDGVSLYNLSVYGDITGTGSFNNTTVTLAAGSTNVSGVSFSGLTLNNASGVTLSGNVSVSGTLLFTSGKITTGSNALTANGTVTGGGTGWVVGNLIKNIPSAATYTFEIGDASNYTPASLNVATVTTAGNVQVSTSSPLNGYTNFGTLKLNTATNYLNRYWTVTNPAGSSFAGAYTGTFTYVAGDLHNSRASFRTGIYNSGWTYGAANPGTLTEATPAGMTTGSTFVFADPIPLTITANNNSKTYGSSLTLNGSTGFTPTGLTGSDAISSVTLTSSGTVATAAATTYSIVPTAATGSAVTSGNYAIGYANGTLTVNQAPLTLTASVQSKTYGATTLSTTGALNSTYTVSGIQNSDVITVSLDYAGGDAATAAATTYTITPSATSATNYTITPVTGTLTVNKAPLSITANNRTKIAGNDITLGSTAFTTSGLVNSDAVTGVTLTSTGSGSGASAGAYDIVPSSASGTGLSLSLIHI